MIRLKSLILEDSASNVSVMWAKRFKQDLGLTSAAAAAMAANIQHESSFIADRVQGVGVRRGTLSDAGNLGYSWAQWTFGPRKQNFREYIKKQFNVDIAKTPATDKHAYAFLKYEVQRYPGFDFDSFKRSRDVDAATEEFVSQYEQAGKPMLSARQAIARDILDKLGAGSDTSTTFVNADFTVFPNPARAGQELTIQVNPNKLPIESISLQILKQTGATVPDSKHQWSDIQQGILKFNAPEMSGTYMIILSTRNALKLVVVD